MSSDNKHLIFVYGTLKNGWSNHRIIEDQKYVGHSETIEAKFQMFSLGGFPGVVAGDRKITGELYEVDDAAFARCDRLEGHPDFYRRQLVTVTDPDGDDGDCLEAWIYIYQGNTNGLQAIEAW